ncbi:hypothetical protein PR001_g147 [Phytophthora rubi]|uniref:Retrovirus-related Pol polyprotein from transposon TNT 1-94-like beta-barrel domain-containing protein n=2 Tax=Phytophthora rubi TaxID=129364 RepID=A0A6A3PAB3_9STRA|nr:hypothetical protein PR001_g147 [Phytophthora rubi]
MKPSGSPTSLPVVVPSLSAEKIKSRLGIGRVELEVIDSKRNMKKLILQDVLYAPQLHFSLLSVSVAVKHDFRFSFDRKKCAMQTNERFSITALMATNTGLYQFQAKPAVSASALIVTSGAKSSVDSTVLRM